LKEEDCVAGFWQAQVFWDQDSCWGKTRGLNSGGVLLEAKAVSQKNREGCANVRAGSEDGSLLKRAEAAVKKGWTH